MKHLARVCLVSAALGLSAIATAQTVKVDGDKVQITDEDGDQVTVDRSGTKVKKNRRMFKRVDTSDQNQSASKKKTRKTATQKKARGAVVCNLTDDVFVKDRSISVEGIALEVKGSCDVIVRDSVVASESTAARVSGSGDIALHDTQVTAKKVAIEVRGSGDVVLDGAAISGPIAIRISGTGDVVAKNSTIEGEIVIAGTGEFEDRGGNTITRK